MATTKEIIISNAVTLLGHKPIITLDNADQMVTAAIQAYDMLLPWILSNNNWRFAVAIKPLVQLAEIPPSPWGAVYQLPSGFLKLLRLYPNIYAFDLYNNNKLYTVLRNGFLPCECDGSPPIPPPQPVTPCDYRGYVPLSIEYVFEPETAQLPPRFVVYFVHEIANYLALSSAQRPDYAAYLRQQTNYHFAMAAANEAQNRPQYSQVLFPVLQNRYLGGFIGNSSGQG
jgi:hypothetical protein